MIVAVGLSGISDGPFAGAVAFGLVALLGVDLARSSPGGRDRATV